MNPEIKNEVLVDKSGRRLSDQTGKKKSNGLVIYPGGKVDERTYVSIAQKIANVGSTGKITPMPIALALFAPHRAEKVIESFLFFKKWVIVANETIELLERFYIHKQSGENK